MEGTEEEVSWKQVKDCFPETGEQLQRLEKLWGSVRERLTRKRRLLTSAMHPSITVTKTLRVFIYHILTDPSTKDSHTGIGKVLPSWTLRIEGGIVDGDQLSPYYRFSQFFEQITLATRGSKGSSGQAVDCEWTRPDQNLTLDQEVDGFETTQMGEKDGTSVVRITMHRRFEPGHERYRLSPELNRLLKLPRESRLSSIEAALLDIISSRGLWFEHQAPTGEGGGGGAPPMVRCDADLQKIFGVQKFNLHTLATRLKGHLSDPDSVTVDYVAGPGTPVVKVVDLQVDARTDLQARCSEIVGMGGRAKKERASIEAKGQLLDRQAQYLFRTVAARTRRLQAYKRLAEDPVGELSRQVEQQGLSREVLGECLGDAALLAGLLGQIEDDSHAPPAAGAQTETEVWGTGAARWIGDAVQAYLIEQQRI